MPCNKWHHHQVINMVQKFKIQISLSLLMLGKHFFDKAHYAMSHWTPNTVDAMYSNAIMAPPNNKYGPVKNKATSPQPASPSPPQRSIVRP